VNRYHTADSAEFRRRLLSGHVPCDGGSDSLNDVRTGDIGDDAQPTAAVRADRQINREYSAQWYVTRRSIQLIGAVGASAAAVSSRRHPVRLAEQRHGQASVSVGAP